MILMKPDSNIAARDIGRIDKDVIKEATLIIGGSYNKRDGKITLYLNEATFVYIDEFDAFYHFEL